MMTFRGRAVAALTLTATLWSPYVSAFAPSCASGLRRASFGPGAAISSLSGRVASGTKVTALRRLSGGSGALGLSAGILDGINAVDIDGKDVDLSATYGNVPAVLVVNVASQ